MINYLMLSPDEEKVLAIGIDAALKPIYDRLEEIAAPTARTVGRMLNAMFCDQVRNVVNVYGRAVAMLDRVGIPLAQVPLKLLKPILDGASMEEDEILQEQWAALLANSSENPSKILPDFPETLRRLSNADARFLSTISNSIRRGVLTIEGIEVEPLFYKAYPEGNREDFILSIKHLETLGLVASNVPFGKFLSNKAPSIADEGMSLEITLFGRRSP